MRPSVSTPSTSKMAARMPCAASSSSGANDSAGARSDAAIR
jgi:hypothetical protein